MFWLFCSTAVAQEGLGSIGLDTSLEMDEQRPWMLTVQEDFWLSPSYLNANYQWTKTAETDYWRQSFSIAHQSSESIIWGITIPTSFVGTSGDIQLQNPTANLFYTTNIRHSELIIGPGLSFKSAASFGWNGMGATGDIYWARDGARLNWDLFLRTRITNQVMPHAVLLLDRQYGNRPIQLGGEVLWLPETKWVGSLFRYQYQLNSLDINLDLRVPLWRRSDWMGSQFGLEVKYYPRIVDRNADRDHDGIPDVDDQCTLESEDNDGFEDEDGCPDLDNDLDGILDVDDQCPIFAEDLDGFEDEDGCPDVDNDQDNILDEIDRCPSEPETVNQYQDQDGCPDQYARNDRDQDSVPDQQDICPFEPENVNGVDDEDGCPESPLQLREIEEAIESSEK